MNVHEAQVRDLLSEVRVLDLNSYVWSGRRLQVLPTKAYRSLTAEAARATLVHVLAGRLYDSFYTRGGISGVERSRFAGSESDSAAFVSVLSEENRGVGHWEPGWRVMVQRDGVTVVQKSGVHLWLKDGEFQLQPGERPSDSASVWNPKELRNVSPGFYMLLGNEALPEDDRLTRVYFHLAPQGSAILVRMLSTVLNEAQVPYRAKVLSDPRTYDRCDAGVLYVPHSSWQRASSIIKQQYSRLRPYLVPRVPALTKEIAPGLGLAEDPPHGDSYGFHRCRLLAEGLAAASRTATTDEARLTVIRETFASSGLDLARPYLNGPNGDYVF